MRARLWWLSTLLAVLTGACTGDAQTCGTGYCISPLVCISEIGCCVDPDWLESQLDGGSEIVTALLDGGLAADAGTPAPSCGPIPRPMTGD